MYKYWNRSRHVLEVVETFFEIWGEGKFCEYIDRRLGDEPFIVADNNKLARDILNWEPKKI